MTKFKCGQKVLIVGTSSYGPWVGKVGVVEEKRERGDYFLVEYHTGEYKTSGLFSPEELVPLPTKYTKDQLVALRSILC